ncbi:MAG: hypothetical protein AAF529_17845 [Pseudomonadota bacterium]
MARRAGAFVAAVVAAYLVGTIGYSQMNLAWQVEMGMPVDAAVRWQTAVHDVSSMLDLYLGLIAVTLLLAFLVTALVLRWVPQLRTLGYVVGGFAGIFVLDFLLGALLTGGTHPLAVTRTTMGLISQCLAGAIGGSVYVRIAPRPASAGTAYLSNPS